MFLLFSRKHPSRFFIIAAALLCMATSATLMNYSFASATAVSNAASCPNITITPDAALPNGLAGSSYNDTLTASGGTAPYSFAVTSGALPDGLSLSAAGVLSGTPTTAAGYSFTVQTTDANGCVGSQDLAMVINTRNFSNGVNVVDAFIGRSILLPASADSVPADGLISGRRDWGFNIYNHSGEGQIPSASFTNPTITLNGSAGMTGVFFPPGGSEAPITWPYVATKPTLDAWPGTNDSNALRQNIGNTNVTETVTPGFDSSRSVSPAILAPGATQNLTVTAKIIDPRYISNNFPLFIGVSIGGANCQSATLPTNMDQGETGGSSCNQFGGGIVLSGAVLGKEYAFNFTVKVPDSLSPSVRYKPPIQVQSAIFRLPGIFEGPVVSIADNLLGGGAVFSVDQDVEWHPAIQDTYVVDYPGVFEAVTDSTPPLITAPDIFAEATSPSGAAVTFSPTATDDTDGTDPVICDATSGATFPLGVTTVHCTATDQAGNTASASFTITVRDTSPPTISCPANMTVYQSSAYGAIVTFAPTASDTVSGVTVSCTPASGSNFSLGTTTVQCTATDASGNHSSCSFTVTVVPPTSTVGVKSTDGGSIPIPGGIGTFGIVAMASSTGFVKGDVEYQDHVTGMNLKSTVITAIVVAGAHARIFGKATINGSGSYDFVVDVDDLGEPGIGSDKFGIQVINGYTAGPAKLSGGNIQIHN